MDNHPVWPDCACLVAVVDAETEQDAARCIQEEWPEFTGEWRFIEEYPRDWMPYSSRFPYV